MKAFFITTDTNDCLNHVEAWNSCFPKAEHYTFNLRQIRSDWRAIEIAQEVKPDVIFYLGAVSGLAIPKYETFRKLRETAPLINLCSDAADKPWHNVLELYKKQNCFDLQVAIDGANEAPVDYVTITPVSPIYFNKGSKDIRCGFSGTVGRWNTRSEVINSLEWFGGLTVRKRGGDYIDHAHFMSRSKMILNTSWTGTGERHHIKGRVLEAGWAGCALLEHKESPIHEWLPKGSYFSWSTPKEAAEIISDASDSEIKDVSELLSKEIREKYTPKIIFENILSHVDITVKK